MANKFCSPFGNNRLCITQTYHSGSNNWAIDCNPLLTGTKAGHPVVAIADGVIGVTSLGAGAYCTLIVNNSPIKLFNVHTYQWLPAGTKVSKGQEIGVLAPEDVAKEPVHLHLGMGKINGVYPNIMDFFDRNISVETKYNDIKADWFKPDGSFDWSKHKNLDYITMNPVIPVCTAGERFVFTSSMNIRDASGNDIGDIAKEAVCEIISASTLDAYQWYKVRFLDMEGYVADTKFNDITTLPITKLDGTIPTPEPEPVPEPPTPPVTPPIEPTTPTEPPVEPEPPQEATKPRTLLEIIIQFFTDLLQRILKSD